MSREKHCQQNDGGATGNHGGLRKVRYNSPAPSVREMTRAFCLPEARLPSLTRQAGILPDE